MVLKIIEDLAGVIFYYYNIKSSSLVEFAWMQASSVRWNPQPDFLDVVTDFYTSC